MNPVTSIGEAKLKPDDACIELCEQLLALAKSGRMRGMVVLVNAGAETSCADAGEADYLGIICALDDWRFRHLAKRNLTCGSCGEQLGG